jgi:hypothetical protein
VVVALAVVVADIGDATKLARRVLADARVSARVTVSLVADRGVGTAHSAAEAGRSLLVVARVGTNRALLKRLTTGRARLARDVCGVLVKAHDVRLCEVVCCKAVVGVLLYSKRQKAKRIL